MNTELMKVYEDLTFKSAKDNNVKRENANIDGDTAMGTMLRYGSEGAKRFYDMFILISSSYFCRSIGTAIFIYTIWIS